MIDSRWSAQTIGAAGLLEDFISGVDTAHAEVCTFSKRKQDMDNGSSIKGIHRTQMTLLHLAMQWQIDLASIRRLLNQRVDPNSRDRKGRTPAHYAFSLGALQELLHYGADLNATDNEGNTPFYSAMAGQRSVQVLHCMLFAGRKLGSTTIKRLLDQAVEIRHTKAARMLIKYGANFDGISISSWNLAQLRTEPDKSCAQVLHNKLQKFSLKVHNAALVIQLGWRRHKLHQACLEASLRPGANGFQSAKQHFLTLTK